MTSITKVQETEEINIEEIKSEAIREFAEWLSEVTTFDCGYCQLHHNCYQGKYKGYVKRLLDEYQMEKNNDYNDCN